MTESVIAELHSLAGRDPPPTEKDEIREELDDLEAEAEMTHEELLAKYGINKDEYNQQKVFVFKFHVSNYNFQI